ncbi:MAG: GAF domain-containing protein [Haloarculaceae archaeon]
MNGNVSRSATARQNGLAELAQRSLGAADLGTLLVEAAALTADATGGDVTVLEVEPDGTFYVHATAGERAGVDVENDATLSRGTVAGTALETAVDDSESVVDATPTDPLAPAGSAGLYVPIRHEDAVWGVLVVHAPDTGAFDEETIAFVENAAGILGSAFVHFRAEPARPNVGHGADEGDAGRTGDVSAARGWGGESVDNALGEVLERVTDAFFALDDDWRFTYVNEQAERLLDRSAEALVGENVWEEFPEAEELAFSEQYRTAMEMGEAVAFEEYFPPLETWFAVRAYPSPTGLSVYFRDVTDRHEREQALIAQSDRQAAVADLGRRALATPDLDALFAEATEVVADHLGADYCEVLEREPSTDRLRLRAGVGWEDELVGSATVGTGADSQGGYTLRTAEPVVVENIATEERFSGCELVVDHDVTSGISVVVGSVDDPWGVLGAHDVEPRTFTDQDVDFVQSVATLLASAIERERYERELERYEKIVETVPDGVYVVGADGRFTMVNDAYAEMTGYDPEELVGSHVSLVVDEGTVETARGYEREMLAGERETVRFESTLETADGDHVPAEATFTMLDAGGDAPERIGVVRDITARRRYEQTLTALHESSRDLLEAESREEIAEVAVETAVDVLGLEATAIYLFDDDAHELQPTAYTEYVGELFGDPPPSFGSGDERITWRTFLDGETIKHEDVTDDEYVDDPAVPLSSGIWIPLGDYGVFATLSTEHDAFDADMERLADLLAATTETALNRLERETTLRARERELEERNERLTQLDQINAIIRDIDEALVGASTREDIETAVCERLTEQRDIGFAWIGEADATTGEVTTRSRAGDQRGYLDAVSLALDGAEPTCRTERSREATVVQNVSDGLRTESWRKEALARDFRSVVSIPIETDQLEYGTLTVYSTEHAGVTGFADVLRELGDTIGNAIDAAETRRTMHSDTGVGIDLRVRDDDPFSLLARQAGCEVEFEGLITQDASEPRVCVSTRGAAVEDIVAAGQSLSSVDEMVLLSKKDDSAEALFEVSTHEPTLATTIAEFGASPRAVTTDGDGSEATAVLSETVPVREFVERLRSRYPDTELLARREEEHARQTPRLFRASVEEELTDRQQEVLQTAYLSGYFEWPRDSTGEELADALGISQPTVNRHLRTAERKVYTLLFDG